MKLTGLHIQGFRSLVDCDIPLRPLMVMVGPNGSGKTALLEVFQLLRRASQRELEKAIEELSGLDATLSKTPPASDRLKVTLLFDALDEIGADGLRYDYELVPRRTGYAVSAERLEQLQGLTKSGQQYYFDRRYDKITYGVSKTGRKDYTRDFSEDLELALSDRNIGNHIDQAEPLRSVWSAIQSYDFLDVTRRGVVRLPQTLTPARRPGPNGENLFSALYSLSSEHRETYERLEDVLRAGFPGFRQLKFPAVGGGQVSMTWHQDDLTVPLYPNQLSEGTLRFLWLTTILLAPDPPPIILIDEPEVSLHPQLLMLLAGLLQDAALRGQVIVATHASDLIHWLQPNEVVVLDKVDGRTTFTWADTLDLSEWLDEYSLRDLWLMGNLGGRS